MQTDKHSGQRMLDIVREVNSAAAEAGNDRGELAGFEVSLDLDLLGDIAAEDFDVSTVLERLTSGARRN